MVSAKGLLYNSPGTQRLIATCGADDPLVVQLYGCQIDIVLEAMERLQQSGMRWFDLNAGCPVPKVVRNGCGAAMLKDERSRENLVSLVRSMAAQAAPWGVGVKFRLVPPVDASLFVELGQALEAAGAGWLTLHPRSASQGFSGRADWSALTRLVEAVSIPVLASGDLHNAAEGLRCLKSTGVAGVMFARGALADPAVFGRLRQLWHTSAPSPTPGERAKKEAADMAPHDIQALLGLIRRHISLSREHGNPHLALLRMRGFIPRYIRSIDGARALRKKIVSCSSWQEMDALLTDCLQCPGLEAHESGGGLL